jgi:predicted MPP superfamily phosphohydrolase
VPTWLDAITTSRRVRRAGAALVTLLGLAVVAAFLTRRGLPVDVVRPLHYVGYLWLAVALYLDAALAGRDPSRPVVLLCHQPVMVDRAARAGVDLQISGHTHGGQLWPITHVALLGTRRPPGWLLFTLGDRATDVTRLLDHALQELGRS